MLYDDKKFIGEVIKRARKSMNLKQAQLAEKVGMSEKNLGNIENGKQFPQVNNFIRLIEVLNLSLEDFGAKKVLQNTQSRNKILQEIFLSSENEINAFMEILKAIKKLNK